LNKILIFQTRPGIGDLVLFLSAIHQIAKQNKKHDIFLVTKERTRAKDVLKYDQHIKKIIYLKDFTKNKKMNLILQTINIYKRLKKYDFNKVYIFHYGIRYFFLCKLMKIKSIFSYEFLKKNENISKKIYTKTKEWLRIKKYNTSANIILDKAFLNFKNKNSIAIGIGSSGLSRRWKLDSFIKLIKLINQKKKFRFYLVAGKNEKKDALKIIKKCKGININSLCDKSIDSIMRTIRGSKFYVGTDSAFMHLSAALKIKSFALFGDTPLNYAEYSKRIKPIIPKNYKTITHGSNAMSKITVDHVWSNIQEFI